MTKEGHTNGGGVQHSPPARSGPAQAIMNLTGNKGLPAKRPKGGWVVARRQRPALRGWKRGGGAEGPRSFACWHSWRHRRHEGVGPEKVRRFPGPPLIGPPARPSNRNGCFVSPGIPAPLSPPDLARPVNRGSRTPHNGPCYRPWAPRDGCGNLLDCCSAYFHPDQLPPWHRRSHRKSALESDGWVIRRRTTGPLPASQSHLAREPIVASRKDPRTSHAAYADRDTALGRAYYSLKSLRRPALRPCCVSFYSWLGGPPPAGVRHCFGAR